MHDLPRFEHSTNRIYLNRKKNNFRLLGAVVKYNVCKSDKKQYKHYFISEFLFVTKLSVMIF